jgi:putative membrane-bound dehydrogenase-like protein
VYGYRYLFLPMRTLFLKSILPSLTLLAAADQQTMVESFTLAPGLEASLWAGTDLIHSPLAMDVDARGRVWVTEDLQNSGEKGPHARIKILEDTDHDGKADLVKIFGPTFSSKPMGISVFDNVVVVSMAPNIHVYTDVNRDDVFDPKVDEEKIIAKGFHGSSHDHALHAVVPGPSGKWYVNHGNIGADVTMSDGREIHSSSYYSQNPQSIGKKSFDGRLYVGGFGLRMNPDGSEAEVVFQNSRNTHAMSLTSLGDILQADNDDPAHARAAWVMEHSNFGYAALEDGNRSWEDSAKSWEKKTVTGEIMKNAYERHSKSSLRRDEGHWREHFPGVTPPGNLWGPGAPTGDYMIEGDELGKEFRGQYLVSETVHRAVFAFRPELRDAQIELGDLNKSFFATDRKSKNKAASGFLPSDVVAGTDGALFVSDWNSHTNARGSGNAMGGIFRIVKKGTAVRVPAIDFSSTKGLLEALKSPSPGVRWVAQDRLKKQEGVFNALLAFRRAHADNPYYQARALFVMAQLKGAKGPALVKTMLTAEDEQWRIVAIRALRMAGRESLLPLIKEMADDSSPAVRREILVMMRGMALKDIREPLQTLIAGYDGKNRWYLEALGTVCDDHKAEVYGELVKPLQPDPKKWNGRQKNLAWRLRSSEALADLADCMIAQNVEGAEFRKLAYTYGLCYSDEERKRNLKIMQRFQKHEGFGREEYQVTITEFLEKDINDPDPVALKQSYIFPTKFGIPSKLGSIEKISGLKPNVDNGRSKAVLCMMCHEIGGGGTSFGPDLTNWGQVRDVATVVRALVDPSAELAHGYDKPLVVTQNGHRLEGISRGYSWHAGAIRVKTMGGVTLKVPHRRPNAKIEYLKDHSWMPSASAMGLSEQDVRDVAAYLMSDIAGEVDSGLVAKLEPEFSRGVGPGWLELTGDDFVNVNCDAETWKWEGSHAWCTGSPTGVIRYHKPLTNFEFSCEWMHKKKGGNSGVFVWATPQSINRLMQGKGRLPQGIEVQVLDLGYKEIYEAQYQKKGDWFTSHGDVFPVGPIKMNPFPPVAPNGRRSFPSKETTLGLNEWNHYYVRALDGVVRLWVNGEEVSGGDGISPAFGFLCLESEGAPIEFKNVRLRVLPPFETKLKVEVGTPPPAPKAVTLEGHAILGKWVYADEHTREFFADGRCILRNGEEVIWTKRVRAVTENSVTLEGGYQHVLKGAILHIEGRYRAKRK